jgi:anti-sigma regulatory factor (Ser/Thr protein kinase)
MLIASSVIQEVMTFLYNNMPSISEEDRYDLKLIFSELLFNALIHGNNKDSSKYVTLSVEIIPPNTIYSSIIDEGNGFDYKSILTQCSIAPTEKDIFNEKGRGIKLVSKLTDKLYFNSTGNQIKFYKRMKV